MELKKKLSFLAKAVLWTNFIICEGIAYNNYAKSTNYLEKKQELQQTIKEINPMSCNIEFNNLIDKYENKELKYAKKSDEWTNRAVVVGYALDIYDLINPQPSQTSQ